MTDHGVLGLICRPLAWGGACCDRAGAARTPPPPPAGAGVTEVTQPDKATRRRRGQTDALDAEAAARAVLSGRATATAKAGDGPVAMMRMSKLAKASAIKSRTQAVNQLKAVLVTADPALRESVSGLGPTGLVRQFAQLGAATLPDPARAAPYTLRLLD